MLNQQNNFTLFSKPSIVLHLAIITLYLILSAYDAWQIVIKYDNNFGYEPQSFGYPKPFVPLVYVALVETIAIVTSVMMFYRLRYSWVVMQSFIIAGTVAFGASEIYSSFITKHISLLSVLRIIVFIWMIFFFYNKKVIKEYMTIVEIT